MVELWEDHLATVKRILLYVAGTSNWGRFGQKKGNYTVLTWFNDADFAGNIDASKSTSWVIFFQANNPVTW
jgi:hypothetical protein